MSFDYFLNALIFSSVVLGSRLSCSVFFYQLCLIFHQLSVFGSVISVTFLSGMIDIRSVVCVSMSCKRDIFDQL